MHGNRRVTREVQAPSRKKSCPDETPEQQQRHREIAQRYGRKKLNKRGGRRLSVLAFRIADLEKFYRAVYGEIMPDNDHRALDHLVVLLHHVAALGDPHAVRACAARWAP